MGRPFLVRVVFTRLQKSTDARRAQKLPHVLTVLEMERLLQSSVGLEEFARSMLSTEYDQGR